MSLCKEDLFVTEDFPETNSPSTVRITAYRLYEIMPTLMSLSLFLCLLLETLGLLAYNRISGPGHSCSDMFSSYRYGFGRINYFRAHNYYRGIISFS